LNREVGHFSEYATSRDFERSGSGLRRDLRGKGRFPAHRFYPACGHSIRPVNLAARQVFLVGEVDAVGVFIARHVGEDNLIADL